MIFGKKKQKQKNACLFLKVKYTYRKPSLGRFNEHRGQTFSRPYVPITLHMSTGVSYGEKEEKRFIRLQYTKNSYDIVNDISPVRRARGKINAFSKIFSTFFRDQMSNVECFNNHKTSRTTPLLPQKSYVIYPV